MNRADRRRLALAFIRAMDRRTLVLATIRVLFELILCASVVVVWVAFGVATVNAVAVMLAGHRPPYPDLAIALAWACVTISAACGAAQVVAAWMREK